ncbi:nitronate monooxygenase [bacterium]|nr:nitronate monooxygenase [bacterium]NUN44247.1 nitronate monooxygenase [bacterium]
MVNETAFTHHAGVQYPILCGAMYPCSNPELVAAVSAAGGLGIIQPLSLTYVHKYDFRQGLRYIRSLTDKPIALNATVEKSSRVYEDRLRQWIDIALEEGIRFFDTSLGNPRWVVDRVAPYQGIVYHKVTERKWAEKAMDAGVHGLIAVNARAGGHAGHLSPQQLYDALADTGLPILCAGGIGDENDYADTLKIGYAGVMMATRFIATTECTAHEDYKRAIVQAGEADIVHTERVTGVPLAVIKTEYVERVGYKTGTIARLMLKHRQLKKMMRLIYALRSMRQLKRSSLQGKMSTRDYYQAGKSVAGVHAVESVAAIIARFVRSTKPK